MNFLTNSHGLVCTFLICGTSLFFPSYLTSRVSNPYQILLFYLSFTCLDIKIQYHTSQLWRFWFTQALMFQLSSFVAQVLFFLHVVRPDFQNSNFLISYHSMLVTFNSHIWTQISDITRASYEVFDLLTRSCDCIPHLWLKFWTQVFSIAY